MAIVFLTRISSLPLSAPVSHCLVSHSNRRRSLGSGLYHGLWSRTQSRSRAFPTLVVAGGRSSRSWDWSSSSYPVSLPSHSQSRTFVALVVAEAEATGPGDSSLPPASFAQPEAGPNLVSSYKFSSSFLFCFVAAFDFGAENITELVTLLLLKIITDCQFVTEP
ncbi:hypothetical protein S83_029225 [Arachis hypogaea]